MGSDDGDGEDDADEALGEDVEGAAEGEEPAGEDCGCLVLLGLPVGADGEG